MLTLCLGVTSCGGEGGRQSHHYEQMTGGLQVFFWVFAIHRHGTSFADTGIVAAIVESSPCEVSGSIEVHDDGRIVFVACSMTEHEIVTGAVLANEQGFVYESLVQVRDGRTSTLTGGYTWASEDVLMVDLTTTYPDFDDGPTVTMRATGQLTTTGDQISGDYSVITSKDVAEDRNGSTCSFDAVPLEELAALLDAPDAFRDFCNDDWELSSSCVDAAEHLCERMPGQGCDTSRMENAVNGVRSACGTRFSVPAAATYCGIFSTFYSIDACVLSGT